MKNYVVVSYDEDQQQTFWDLVPANSEEEAQIEVSELRDYAFIVEVMSPSELERMALDYKNTSVDEAHEAWESFKEQEAEEDDE